MNSFSTDSKMLWKIRRHAAWTAMVFLFLAIAGFVGMRLYSARQDKIAAKFGREVPQLAQRLTIAGVENASRVSDFLYRGAQPRGDGYEELKKLGISIVVDLRNSKPVKGDGGETREQVKVEAAGMRYVELPASAFFGPTDFQVATFLKLLHDNPKQEIFVHCYFGDDRTGVMIATYRIAEDHWTSDEAYNEMRAFHFHKHLLLMGHHVKIFPADYALNPVFGALREAGATGGNSRPSGP
jgi:protein-tyrosine phosphatase